MNKKYLYLIFGLGVFLFLLVFVSVLNVFRSSQISTELAGQSKSTKTFLRLVKISPQESPSREYLPIISLELTFSVPVEPETFFFTVDPFVKVMVKSGVDMKTITLTPESSWTPGTTTIEILSQTRSTEGLSLEKNLNYTFRTAFPSGPSPDEEL